MDNIGENDFLLVIQTEFQRDGLQKWGTDTICTDTTYNTNAYDFNLITLLVLDDFGPELYFILVLHTCTTYIYIPRGSNVPHQHLLGTQ